MDLHRSFRYSRTCNPICSLQAFHKNSQINKKIKEQKKDHKTLLKGKHNRKKKTQITVKEENKFAEETVHTFKSVPADDTVRIIQEIIKDQEMIITIIKTPPLYSKIHNITPN